jgi:hypothetical protein
MTLRELLEIYERRRSEAERVGAMAPLAEVYRLVIEEIQGVQGSPGSGRWLSASEAAQILGMDRKTVAIWAAQGKFPGATKDEKTAEWHLPVASVFSSVRNDPQRPAAGRPGGR